MNPETLRRPPDEPRLQVLHLEDSEHDAVLIEHALTEAGLDCNVTRANSRQVFSAALARIKYDLILADYTLPGYDGATALADAHELQPTTPFIFVSGTIGEEQAIEIMKVGATDYVLKHRLARLVPSVRRAVQEVREHERRQQAEQALKESVERLQEMAENIQEVFWVRSADGFSIHYVSPACEQIWGQPPTELYRTSTRWIEAVVPQDRPRLHHAMVQLGQGLPYTLEYRITRPDGSQRSIEERAFPVRSPNGMIARTVAASIDITERKKLQEQLQQSQKMEAIGQLAGGIAHDFSNMLTVINGYSNLLLDTPGLPADVAESLQQIYVAGGRAANLTRQLLIFSRKAHAQTQIVDLNDIITDLTTMLGRLLGEQITLQLDLAHKLPRTFADAGMIEQVLMNLVVNARDATAGPGTIVVSTGSSEVTAEDCKQSPHANPGPHVWLSVRDTGSGIPPDVLPRIFEPFFTTKEAGRGTGLGLSTVIGIARQHGGWVEVESEVGAGTLFRVFLPFAPEQAAIAAPAAAAITTVTGGKETILLVEHEDSVRTYARTVLEMYGYRVLQATNGRSAAEAWKWHHEKIALLLTDLVMSDGISGLDLVEKLQRQRPDLKVLICSGHNPDPEAALRAVQRGCSFLQKPYQPKALGRMVRDILDDKPRSFSHAPFPGKSSRP